MTPLLPRLSLWQQFRLCALRRQYHQTNQSHTSPVAEQSLWKLVVGVARSLTVCTSLGALVVVSHVITDVTGSGTTLALLVTALLSWITEETNRGFQHGFISSSGTTYTRTYSKFGELAAFSVALSATILDVASCALTARVISATLNHLTGGVIGNLIGRIIHQSAQLEVFDPIAGVVCCISAALISLGIERTAWMDVSILSSTTLATALYTIISALFSGHSHWQRAPFMPRGVVGFADACGILSLAYRTRSIISAEKPEVPPDVPNTCAGSEPIGNTGARLSPRITAIATLMMLFVYTNLASSASLLLAFNTNETCSRARVLDGLDPIPGLHDSNTKLLHLVSIMTGCLATISLCLLTTSLLSSQHSSLGQLSADRLIPCNTSSSCQAVSVCFTAGVAVFINSCWLLKMTALMQLVNSACSIAGYIVVSHSKLKTAKDTTPSCYQISCGCCHDNQSSAHLTSCTAEQLSSGLQVLGRHRNETEYIQTPSPSDIPLNDDSDSETGSAASGYESNNSDIEDFDSIVATYLLENPQVITKSKIEDMLTPEPTSISSQRVRVGLILLAGDSVLIGSLLLISDNFPASIALICAKITALALAALLIGLIAKQPQVKLENSWLCRQSWLQCFGLAAILVALTTVLCHVWLGFVAVVVFGLAIYTYCSMRNSSAQSRNRACYNRLKHVQTSSSSSLMST